MGRVDYASASSRDRVMQGSVFRCTCMEVTVVGNSSNVGKDRTWARERYCSAAIVVYDGMSRTRLAHMAAATAKISSSILRQGLAHGRVGSQSFLDTLPTRVRGRVSRLEEKVLSMSVLSKKLWIEAFPRDQSRPRLVTTSFKGTHMARMAGGACVEFKKDIARPLWDLIKDGCFLVVTLYSNH